MNDVMISDSIINLQDISKIDVKDLKSIHLCIKKLDEFNQYLSDLFNNELPNLAGFELLSYNTYVLRIHEIFVECIRDIKKYEGVDFYKTRCLLVTCERLIIFFMGYIDEYNNMVADSP